MVIFTIHPRLQLHYIEKYRKQTLQLQKYDFFERYIMTTLIGHKIVDLDVWVILD